MTTEFATNIVRYFELLAGLTGIICYYKKRQSIWFTFAVFLICLFGFETLAHWFGNHKMYEYNKNLYKWMVIPYIFTMYHIAFYKIVNIPYKFIAIFSCALLLLLAIFENLFLAKEHSFSISLTLSFGCLSILFFSLVYFFQLLKSNDILHFKRLMPFWFCIGVFIFYLGNFPNLTFYNSLAISKNEMASHIFRWAFIILNYLMYILFTIGFICSRPKQ